MIKRLKRLKLPDKLSLSITAIGLLLSIWAIIKSSEANKIAIDANKASATANAIAASANELSNTANGIARQANEVAVEANRINKQEAKPHPRVIKGPGFENFMVFTCNVEESEKPFGVIVAVTPVFTVANYGAQPIWLHKTVLKDKDRHWRITLHEQHDDLFTSYELLPESEHRWIVVGLHSAYFETKTDAWEYVEEFPTYFDLEIEFQFENEVNLTWPFTLTFSSSDIDNAFDTACRQWFITFATQY